MQKLMLLICIFMTTTVAFPGTSEATASAQDNTLSAFNKRAYGQMKDWLRSAEKVPEQITTSSQRKTSAASARSLDT